ncbi:hypothetical protein C8J55DRAFT_260901 [Lentinula edodes]|uniref:Uncharacterized protein n=1 Tax=Lentinula lateritia TaxID=40482 RepID=A0A9W8ZTF1_9AGAR|nr:hypothetical protein C8J55DRAFT_260901 [Lentinula edodes]
MLFPNRIFLSLSALSPTLFPFLSLLSLALVINSVVTFAEATPVPPKNLQPSGLQFEKCTSSQSSEFLFRVAFYDTQTGSTTKLGQGVLIICIGSNHCFGYSTTETTTAGGPGSNSMSRTDTRSMVGTVIRTSPRKKPLTGLWSRAYHRLSITPDCDKFNSWSPPHDQEEHSPEITLVDFLTSIADLQNALREYAHTNSDATVTIDSDVSYILAILDYLHSKGMLTTYDKPQIGEFLETLRNTNKISGSSMLSWGFRNLQGRVR